MHVESLVLEESRGWYDSEMKKMEVVRFHRATPSFLYTFTVDLDTPYRASVRADVAHTVESWEVENPTVMVAWPSSCLQATPWLDIVMLMMRFTNRKREVGSHRGFNLFV